MCRACWEESPRPVEHPLDAAHDAIIGNYWLRESKVERLPCLTPIAMGLSRASLLHHGATCTVSGPSNGAGEEGGREQEKTRARQTVTTIVSHSRRYHTSSYPIGPSPAGCLLYSLSFLIFNRLLLDMAALQATMLLLSVCLTGVGSSSGRAVVIITLTQFFQQL